MIRWPALTLPLVLLALAVVAAWWLWTRRAAVETVAPGAATPTAIATPAASATLIPPPSSPPPGYRLAGVAVGEPESFVVLELPNGRNVLYRLDAEVPGLGRLIRIEAERVVVEGESGRFDLWLGPAATATPARRTPALPALVSPTPTGRPRFPARRGDITPGSTP